MRDWLDEVISDDLISVYEGFLFTEDALLWLRERPRTFGSCGRGTSTGCGGWLPVSMTRICWRRWRRILIPTCGLPL